MYLPVSIRGLIVGLIVTAISSLLILLYSILLFLQIKVLVDFIGFTNWYALMIYLILMFFGLFGFVFITLFSSRLLVNLYDASIEKKKRKRDINYEFYLLKVADPNLILEYFDKIRTRLPDSLHNIMLGYSVSKNPYAMKYVSSIDSKTGNLKSWTHIQNTGWPL